MSVTDSDSVVDPTINSRNSLAELEARAMKALGVTDSDDEPEATIKRCNAYNLMHEAKRTAEVCGKCGRELPDEETVYIDVVMSGARPWTGTYYRWYAPVCESCASRSLKEKKGMRVRYGSWTEVYPERACETCGRMVVWRTAEKRYRNRRHVFCSERCQWTYYNAVRNERNARDRQKVCEVCEEPFTATRRDAKTCSKACKQKAYRQRQKEEHRT